MVVDDRGVAQGPVDGAFGEVAEAVVVGRGRVDAAQQAEHRVFGDLRQIRAGERVGPAAVVERPVGDPGDLADAHGDVEHGGRSAQAVVAVDLAGGAHGEELAQGVGSPLARGAGQGESRGVEVAGVVLVVEPVVVVGVAALPVAAVTAGAVAVGAVVGWVDELAGEGFGFAHVGAERLPFAGFDHGFDDGAELGVQDPFDGEGFRGAGRVVAASWRTGAEQPAR